MVESFFWEGLMLGCIAGYMVGYVVGQVMEHKRWRGK